MDDECLITIGEVKGHTSQMERFFCFMGLPWLLCFFLDLKADAEPSSPLSCIGRKHILSQHTRDTRWPAGERELEQFLWQHVPLCLNKNYQTGNRWQPQMLRNWNHKQPPLLAMIFFIWSGFFFWSIVGCVCVCARTRTHVCLSIHVWIRLWQAFGWEFWIRLHHEKRIFLVHWLDLIKWQGGLF